MKSSGEYYSSLRTREQDKAFEIGLAIISENDFDRWRKIAEIVPGKTIEEIKCHYEILVEDINAIESDLVPLPSYYGFLKNDNSSRSNDFGFEGGKFGDMQSNSPSGIKSLRSERERHKGIAWTEEEHRLFLEGLAKYGKGDWRSISRHFVISRTPTQVASHAQKYFIRLNSSTNEKRQPSIHDITNKGKAIESSNSLPTVKPRGSKASSKKSGSHTLSYDNDDISNFVPPAIVQSSFDFDTKIVTPAEVVSLQKDSAYDDMALSPGSLFDGLPELTKLH